MDKLLVAYKLTAHDDGSSMLGEATYRVPREAGFHDFRFGVDGEAHPATCANCGRKIDPDFVNPVYRVRHRRRDAVATYDGYLLVSRRFRALCEERGWSGAEFVNLPADHDFFWLRPTGKVRYDAQRRGTRFEDYCAVCDAYYNVIGSDPVYLLDVQASLPAAFFRTDLEFASGPEQHPLVLVGPDVGSVLLLEHFPMLEVRPVYYDFNS